MGGEGEGRDSKSKRKNRRLDAPGRREREKGRKEGNETPRVTRPRLCEIKTRFTASFYCGLHVSFVSLLYRATVAFNRFNEYIVYQWSPREYRASLSSLSLFLFFPSFLLLSFFPPFWQLFPFTALAPLSLSSLISFVLVVAAALYPFVVVLYIYISNW